jgi:YD repeat-containing protein
LDEAILTPTNDSIKAVEEQAFNEAMNVWFSHRYADGEKLLAEFAKKHPDSRWRAEAEMHRGCYLTYLGQSETAKPIFEKLVSEFANTPIRAKATLRLANIAEREAKTDDAIANYAKVLRMNPTWDQFKYANYHARKLMMTRGKQEARINCGPVALAACLEALGRKSEATTARGIKPTTDGVSLGVLEAHCAMYGIPARAVEMAIDELPNATLPVLAYVEPKHFVAVLGVKDGKAQIEDSIRGKYEMPLDSLSGVWAGKVMTFSPTDQMQPLTLVASLETTGGCCGQIDEDECLGDPCECQHTASGGSGDGNGGLGCCGGGNYAAASPGRPTWQVNANNLNILVKDTPVFYNPGKGPNIAFTLAYSNENSNTGIFGRGWRSPYDMKLFFLPATDYAETTTTTSFQPESGSLTVLSTAGFPWEGAIVIGSGVNSEVIYYRGTTQNSFTIVGRGPVPIFALSGSPVRLHTPTLQLHLDNGRIETYEWDDYYQSYSPRVSTANYGYRNTIQYGSSGVVLSLRGGGKYYFMPEGSAAEGRIKAIEDQVGNQVTCSYDANGCLDYVTDANGGVTDIVTEGTGINERVTDIRIPRYVSGQWVSWANDDPDERREAVLDYTDGNLTYIKDMLEDASTLSYDAMLFYTVQASSYTYTSQAITTTSPANGGAIPVSSTDGFFSSGKIKINNDEEITYTGKTVNSFTGITRGATPKAASSSSLVVQVAPDTTLSTGIDSTSTADLVVADNTNYPSDGGWIAIVGNNGTETLRYTGKSGTTLLTGITRGEPAYAANSGSEVCLCSQSPYLSEIVTPSKKSKFTYEWYSYYSIYGRIPHVVGLHEVYECGPTESYPDLPTIHYAWCPYQTAETRYPTTVHDSTTDRCNWGTGHWTGGLTKMYDYTAFYDASTFILDELGNYVVQYSYNDKRDRTTITDASGNTTEYYYIVYKNTIYGDGKHDMYFRRDPLDNEWAYTYNADHSLHTESDAYGRTVKTYTYNSAGQVTQIDTPIGTQVTNHYDAYGRLDYSTDARGKTTYYHYNEDGETRGLLTSVHDPDGKATLYHYDANGRRDQITDPSGNVTRFEYDDLDRVTKTIYGSGQNDPYVETKYTCCHKVYEQDENGRRTYYVYDAKVRPYKTIASAKSTTLATSITTTVPANNGDLAVASVADFPNSGKVVVLDEIISYTGRDTQNNLLTGITRGADGTRIVEADSDFPVGRVDTVPATYGYHSQYLDWMISLTDAMNHTTYYEYYLNGKLKTIRYPDDTGERYTYASPSFEGQDPANNNSGVNMTKKEYGTYLNQTFSPSNDLTVNYEYDANNRLLRTYH